MSTDGSDEAAAPTGGGDVDLPLDQVFEILRNQRRRHVLRLVGEANEPLRIGELAEEIAALENDKEPHEITSSERKRVYVGLYQAHLPKMDGMDVISFNKPRGIIEPDVNLGAFDEYIDSEARAPERPWHRYYAGLSIGGIALLVVALVLRSALGFPIVELSLILVVALFAATSCWNVLSVRSAQSDPRSSTP